MEPALLVFTVWRLADFLLAYATPRFLPFLGFFPYSHLLNQFPAPSWISSLANFDGIHYLLISHEGYAQYEQAYFPLYPLLTKLVSYLFPLAQGYFAPRNVLTAALLVSNASFLAALYVFGRVVRLLDKKMTPAALTLIVAFPTSFFFGAVYTEGLFFFLLSLSLYFLYRKRYRAAAVCAALSSGTRLIGVFLMIPFFFEVLPFLKKELRRPRVLFSIITFVLSPLIGLAAYALYLWKNTGDPLFFFHAQPAFGANRSTHLILPPQVIYRYIRIAFTAAPNYQYAVSLFEFAMFSLICTLLVLDLKKHYRSPRRLALNLFSWANIVLPTLTGTFSSVPRYALFSISAFLFLGEITNRWVRGGIGVLFVIVHAITLALFVQGYFVG